ncbi:class I SAM-dependent methyltransferase [Endozoicomonas sp. Mp262]|uniref:methyltransferase n=1 Tax=Endozoicomonas sp. Mp262 TaxID=2919499 RepID=UPI0021DA25B7
MISEVLSNSSQLVLRNAESLHCKRLLMVGMPADGLAATLLADDRVSELQGLTRDFSVFRTLKSAWADAGDRQHLCFGSVLEGIQKTSYDGVLIFLQKSKPLMDFWLDMALSVLDSSGCIWLVGENKEGIKSWRKRLKHYFGDVRSLDSARHCGLLEGSQPVKSVDNFNRQDYFQGYAVQLADKTIKVSTLPGVFSHGRLDRGTDVLLDTFKGIAKKNRVLDFGCGAGVVATALASVFPEADFTLIDCDALALESSRKTLQDNGVGQFKVLASDGLSEVTGQFDLIVSNPPFHQGVKTHYEVTEQFLVESRRHLTVGGELRIVANSFLRYQPIIKKAFGHCETLVTRDGFSVYSARRC